MTKRNLFISLIALLFISIKGYSQSCAVSFDGVDDKSYTSRDTNQIKHFTISFWFKASGPGPLFSSSQDSMGNTGIGDKRIWVDGTGILYGGVYNAGVHSINSNTNVLDSNCHHLAFTQSDNGIQLYIDGVSKGTDPTVSSDQTSTSPFYWVVGHCYMIGDWQPQPPTYFFNGTIDELTIWSKAFTPAGVTDTLLPINYSSSDQGLLQYFDFNSCNNNYAISSAPIPDTLHYQNGVLPATSTCVTNNAIKTGSITGSPFCMGGIISVPYLATGYFDPGNVFTVQLSDSSGNFIAPVDIGNISSTATNGTITVTLPGGTIAGTHYHLRVVSSSPVLTGSPDSSSLIISPTVTVSISISSSDSIICSGTTVVFTSSASNQGISPVYQWKKNGANVGTNSPVFLDSSLADNDSVLCILTSSTACATPADASSNTVIMAVSPPARAGIIAILKDTICQNTIAHLSLNGSTGAIQWQSSDSTNDYSDITGASTTSYATPPLIHDTYFRVTVSNGVCSDTSDAKHIIVLAAPLAIFTDSVIGLNTIFNSSGSTGAVSYSWDFGDTTALNTQPNPVHQFPGIGTYHVCLTVKNNSNCNFTVCHNVFISTNEIGDEASSGSWSIYPNPIGNEIFINGASNSGIENIELFDAIGRKLINKKYSGVSDNPIKMDVSLLPKGIYYLKINTHTSTNIHPVVKQ